jgi:hypothetical protein
LRPRFYGPFRVSAVINNVAYRLDLPPTARIHDVFHVALLKKHVGPPPVLPPMHNGAIMPQPERAFKARLARGIRKIVVHWKGETAASATWEDLVSFIERYPEFQLEDELLVEGGDVMWGQHYCRHARAHKKGKADSRTEQADEEESG